MRSRIRTLCECGHRMFHDSCVGPQRVFPQVSFVFRKRGVSTGDTSAIAKVWCANAPFTLFFRQENITAHLVFHVCERITNDTNKKVQHEECAQHNKCDEKEDPIFRMISNGLHFDTPVVNRDIHDVNPSFRRRKFKQRAQRSENVVK